MGLSRRLGSTLARQEFYGRIRDRLQSLKSASLFKDEQIISSPQASNVLINGKHMVNFCANNYLGLSDHPQVLEAGKQALDKWGMGMSSVRFICGTQTPHKHLEARLSGFHGTKDTILYSSCFDANAGLFETILGPEDAVVSDALNHASVIDGIRLCRAQRLKYQHSDMHDMESQLQAARSNKNTRTILIASDGVFSMDGEFAKLPQILDLATKYQALVYIDESHATGVVGKHGRGTLEYFGIDPSAVDIVCSTLGKALGGASGGYATGSSELITLLRQASRPYLFSNSMAPVMVASAMKALDLVDERLLAQLHENTQYFRTEMKKIGLELMGHVDHPICPILVGDASRASRMAEILRSKGILVIAFSYPVVPKGMARIRVQISAAHTRQQIDALVAAIKIADRDCR